MSVWRQENFRPRFTRLAAAANAEAKELVIDPLIAFGPKDMISVVRTGEILSVMHVDPDNATLWVERGMGLTRPLDLIKGDELLAVGHGPDDATARFPIALPDGGEITADDAFGLVGRELLTLGNAMASAIEEHWTGNGTCECPVCTAARAWRSAVSREGL